MDAFDTVTEIRTKSALQPRSRNTPTGGKKIAKLMGIKVSARKTNPSKLDEQDLEEKDSVRVQCQNDGKADVPCRGLKG
jgi:hypothetical protein